MKMTTSVKPWEETFSIRSYEVEPGGRASVQAICQYLQEGASNHAKELGFSVENMIAHNLTWVMSRLHVEVDRYPTWRDRVKLTTWPSRQNGLMATREFLLHAPGGERLARATSAWLLIDLKRRRPVRLPDFILELLLPDRERALEDSFAKMVPPEVDSYESRFDVRWSDLDLNAHVNNVRYVEWAIEGLPPTFREGRCMKALEVNFRLETRYGATVVVQSGSAGYTPEDSATRILWHRLHRADDGREIAFARTTWVPSEAG